MRLRAKLTLTIAAASIIPIVAAALVGRELVQQTSRAEFAQLLKDGEIEILTRFRALEEEVRRAVERLADAEDRFTGPIFIAVANGGPDDETFRQLALVTQRVMAERGLDVLTVFGPRGEILASGHFPGRIGDQEPGFLTKAKHLCMAKHVLINERVLQQGKPTSVLSVQTWRVAHSPLGAKITVVGGRALNADFVQRLRLRGGTEVRIQDAEGKTIAGPSRWSRYALYPQLVIPLLDQDDHPTARITIAVPDDRLRATLRAINYAAFALAVSGLLLALILGSFAARRISHRLQKVARGAEAVAAGDLSQRLPLDQRDEIGELVESFNRMTGELQESKEKLVVAERVAAWQEIAQRIAHEIKNPLFPIQTSMETLRKVYRKKHPAFEEIFEESTKMILEEVQRLKNIVTEFSQFARLPKPRLEPCCLKEIIGNVSGLYGQDTLFVQCTLATDLPLVIGDKEQLTQVLVNLIKNAQEAMSNSDQPRLSIHASTQANGVELIVQDNGPGFDAEVGQQIFAPYFTTKGARGGSGLGLAIVHRIIIDHGGRIEARSETGRGASFIIWLPQAV